MESLEAGKLSELMQRTEGNLQIKVGLIDGSIVSNHPSLAQAKIEQLSSTSGNVCTWAHPVVCRHGTFISGRKPRPPRC